MYPCDVTKDEDIARVFEQVGKDFGKLHILLHSVAYAPKEHWKASFSIPRARLSGLPTMSARIRW